MSDADTYESEDEQAGVGSKYYQIYVPNYAKTPLVPTQADDNGVELQQTTSSFLRLGVPLANQTSVYGDPSTTFGDQLLTVALASTPSSTGNGVFDAATAAAGTIKTFTDDCAALAKAVGDAVTSTVAAYVGNTSPYTPNSMVIAASAKSAYADAVAAGLSATQCASAAQSAAVAAALSPFVDDTRDQGTKNNANGLPVADRIAESGRLFTKGGWRDHTDGNRVTTTYGDKVEVIRGNYKLVVLGRQDAISNGHTWESSGGVLQDNDAAPGQLTEVKWVETQGGTWRMIETTTKGDVETTFDGKVVERFIGGSVTSIVGREELATTSSSPLNADEIAQLTSEWKQALGDHYVDSSLTFDAFLTQRGYNKNGGAQSQDWSYAEGGGQNPVVYEQTWATRIESYTGSSNAPVPEIIETTYATTISETTHASTLNEDTNADTLNSTTTVKKTLTEKTNAAAIVENTIVAGGILSTTVASTTMEVNTVGIQSQINLGATWEATLGIAFETNLGPKVEVRLGPEATINFGVNFEYTNLDIGVTAFKWEKEGTTLKASMFSGANKGMNFLKVGLAVLL